MGEVYRVPATTSADELNKLKVAINTKKRANENNGVVKKKRKYTMSEKALEARRKSGFRSNKQNINTEGKGGFNEHPENRAPVRKAIATQVGELTWFNSYREALHKFSLLTTRSLNYIAYVNHITDTPVELDKYVREELIHHFITTNVVKNLPTVADSALRMILMSKNEPKLIVSIMENVEGKATQRVETKNVNTNVNAQAMQQLVDENKALRAALDRVTKAMSAQAIETVPLAALEEHNDE